ncbi:MAG: portal protein, partial [Spirochaetota bacterium]
IPIVPVLGDELDVNGKRILEGIVRHAKDPARMYNYWVSAETEMIALAPKAPFIGVAGQFEGYEEKWTQANRKNLAYLEYNPKTVAGNLAPPPQRNQYEPPIQAINHARMASRDDLKATTGIYASSLGEQGNEQTGRAILARQHQGQISNFHYIDNMTRAIRHVGRILVDLIPKIYDTKRIVRIIAPDGGQKMVEINGQAGQAPPGQAPVNGTDPITKVERIYALGVGKYDVVVEAGPSYHTKREEALASMLQLSQNYPKLMEVAGDIVVGNMDWEGALEISERLKKTLPPGYAKDEQGGEEMPPEAIKKIQDMQLMIETQTKALEHALDENKEKEDERESREKIEFAKLRNALLIETMKIDQKDSHVLAQNELKWIDMQMQASQAEVDASEASSEAKSPQEAQSTLAPTAPPTYTDASVPTGPGSPVGPPPPQ